MELTQNIKLPPCLSVHGSYGSKGSGPCHPLGRMLSLINTSCDDLWGQQLKSGGWESQGNP